MRDAITKALASGEATTKAVAKRAGLDLADVLKTLGHMQRDAEVEREKRHGNEYVYWLAKPSAAVAKPEVSVPVSGDSEGGESDLRKQIAELEAEAIRLADAANKALRDRDQARRSESEKHERMMQACSEADRLRTDLAAALIDRDALREQLDSIPTVEAHTAGYLVRAPKRKPAIVTKAESAVARAMAAARNGSGRADVYALVLTGSAKRGAEWRPAE